MKDALRWMEEALPSPSSAAARRMGTYFDDELGRPDGGEWSAAVASRFNDRVA